MAAESLLDDRVRLRRERIVALLDDLGRLVGEIGREDLSRTVGDLRAGIDEPFLFVVVGEVKTGKSSLINALLGQDVCQVAPDPCTDRIRVITHGLAASETAVSDLLSRATVTAPLLRDIAIVDTPGVDSIIDRHQDITEDFIPRGDLVLFVFSALNPYSRSAWEFLALVREAWRRKVVFVLNQADLATPEQIRINSQRLRELAAERGLADPTVFLVSAARGLCDPQSGGIEALRTFIRETVTGGRRHEAKLDAVVAAGREVLSRAESVLAAEAALLAEDRKGAARIEERIGLAREAAGGEAESLLAGVSKAYARLSGRFALAVEAELAYGNMLSRSVGAFFRRGRGGLSGTIDDLATALRADLSREVEEIVRTGVDRAVERMLFEVRLLIEELAGRRQQGQAAGPEALGDDRSRILAEVTAGLAMVRDGQSGPGGPDPEALRGLEPRAAMGGALVVLGAVFAMSVKSVVVDVTGGLVAATGMILAGSALLWKRPRVLAALRRELEASGERLDAELRRRLDRQLDEAAADIRSRFAPVTEDIARREARFGALSRQAEDLAKGLAEA